MGVEVDGLGFAPRLESCPFADSRCSGGTRPGAGEGRAPSRARRLWVGQNLSQVHFGFKQLSMLLKELIDFIQTTYGIGCGTLDPARPTRARPRGKAFANGEGAREDTGRAGAGIGVDGFEWERSGRIKHGAWLRSDTLAFVGGRWA